MPPTPFLEDSARPRRGRTRPAPTPDDGAVELLQIDQQPGAGPVLDLAFDPDGRCFATAGADGSVRLWDGGTGEQLVHRPLGQPVTAVAVGDGRRLAIVTVDGAVHVGTGASPEGLAVGHTGARAVAFDGDGGLFATAGVDGTARVWDGFNGDEVARLTHGGPVATVAFHAEGTSVATAAADGTARVWDVVTGRELHHFAHPAPVRSVAFAAGGKALITAGADGSVRLFDLRNAETLLTLRHRGLFAPNWAVRFSPRGAALAVAGADGFVRTWGSISDGAATAVIPAGSARALTWRHDETALASGSTDGTVQLWALAEAATPLWRGWR